MTKLTLRLKKALRTLLKPDNKPNSTIYQLDPDNFGSFLPVCPTVNTPMDIPDCIICPGCGWTGENGTDELKRGACPKCGYENGVPPNRLLTLNEMRKCNMEYNDVRLDLFLEAYIALLQ